jgi:hypothetical protein
LAIIIVNLFNEFEDYGKIENAGLTREFINAKYNVAMHFPDYMAYYAGFQ